MTSQSQRLWRAGYGLLWLAAAVTLVTGAVVPGWVEWAAPGFFLASAVLFGLLHGTADPWIPQCSSAGIRG